MFAVHVKDLRDAPDVFTSFKNQVPPMDQGRQFYLQGWLVIWVYLKI